MDREQNRQVRVSRLHIATLMEESVFHLRRQQLSIGMTSWLSRILLRCIFVLLIVLFLDELVGIAPLLIKRIGPFCIFNLIRSTRRARPARRPRDRSKEANPGDTSKERHAQDGQSVASHPDRRNRSWRQSTQHRRNDTLTDPFCSGPKEGGSMTARTSTGRRWISRSERTAPLSASLGASPRGLRLRIGLPPPCPPPAATSLDGSV